MNRRRLIPLVLGVALCSLGVSLIVYGSTLPADFVVHGIWRYSSQDETNILVLFGALMVPIGISFLLFWFFTRLKPASAKLLLKTAFSKLGFSLEGSVVLLCTFMGVA